MLEISLPPRLNSQGKAPRELFLQYVRDISLEDLQTILVTELGSEHRPLQRIRQVHHSIAMLLAQGKEEVDVSRITGRSPANIRMLKQDPAFQNLLRHYTQMGVQAMADVFQQLSDTGQAALAALQEKLEEDPDSIPDNLKIKIVEVAMDRTGHGPSRTVRNLSTADAIRDLVERKKAEDRGRVIDVAAE